MNTMLGNVKIRFKIAIVLALMAALCFAAGVVGLVSMERYNTLVHAMEVASKRSVTGERVNGLILSVVMDSRGIYMAQSAEDVKKFGTPLLKSLNQLQQQMDYWLTLLPESRQHELEAARKSTAEFISFRKELVRLAAEESIASGRAWGDNDANRNNRKKLNDQVVALADTNNKEIEAATAELDSYYATQRTLIYAILALGLPLGCAVSLLAMYRWVIIPLRRITSAMMTLAGGEIDIHIPALAQKDEIGDMARALDVFKQNAVEKQKMEEEQADAQAVKERRSSTIARLIAAFEASVVTMMKQLGASAQSLEQTSTEMSSIAQETNIKVQHSSEAATKTTDNVNAVAAAAEEMHVTVQEISAQITRANTIVNQAVKEANGANEIMRELSELAQRISAVTEVIDTIAAQINLLALNATIESARAGEAGKGFAVVASEVKALAIQTQSATGDITNQINAVQASVEKAAASIHTVNTTISSVSQISMSISSAVEEQSTATQEVASNAILAAGNTGDVSNNIRDVSHASQRVGTVANDVTTSFKALTEVMEALQTEINGFLSGIQQA